MNSIQLNVDMQLSVNGENLQLKHGANIVDLLHELQLTEKPVAVEVNRTIIPRSLHSDHILQPDDQVEIVHAIGGG